MVRLFNDADLKKIPRSTIVEYVLDGINILERDISLNALNKDIELSWETPERKIHINNLIKLLNILIEEGQNDPLAGKILLEAEILLEFLKKLKSTIEGGEKDSWLLGKEKSNPERVNEKLRIITVYLEEWKNTIKSKIKLPLGNNHTKDTYHPEFEKTYKYIPRELPHDHRSNFFFEVHIKELCPYTTMIQFLHPYSDVQSEFQETQSFDELSKTDIDVDLTDSIAIEQSDNIRAIRMHGPLDNKEWPGSYIIVKGGLHRLRAIFQKYLQGKIRGRKKILIQRVDVKDFKYSDFTKEANNEIEKRELTRKKLQ
ncbi:hypothetical protein HOD38_04585 [archaeon]|jgi:hypothetical protein|nr:hypothetical protein [archaeon]MBT4397519.1 hypothetical protein [archaeon]MBT4440849.1 hypothetical protein [archaeon]